MRYHNKHRQATSTSAPVGLIVVHLYAYRLLRRSRAENAKYEIKGHKIR